MKIIVEKDYEQMSQTVLHKLLAVMYKDKNVHIAITAGATPKRLYELLIQVLKDKAPFTNVIYYNFDEIPFAKSGGDGVTFTNLAKMFFKPAHIDSKYIHQLDEHNYKTHDNYLKKIGGLDAMFLGLGTDGHFCGNLPHTTTWTDETVRVDIPSKMKTDPGIIAEVGGNIEEVPDFYVTMGPKAVMATKEIVMFVNGEAKAEMVKRAFFGRVGEDVPSSIFQLHPNFTLILDEAAASLIKDLL